jgi:hypothetical protein
MAGISVRKDVAMTGEITLRGNVLQIGGVKEKLLAAHRAGIKRVIIPERNVKDLVDVPDEVKNEIEIIPVKRMDEVLVIALTTPPPGIVELVERQKEAELAGAIIPAGTPPTPKLTTNAPDERRNPRRDTAGLTLRSASSMALGNCSFVLIRRLLRRLRPRRPLPYRARRA